ncbi:molybdate ABC transporter substrate-binding protein [Promicromonospora citrea]|uniref:Molybdate-binding protein n=1 Tax=Promicromonospora citrea TaxID=43677 RepID=A0A8H9GLL5_9MICO|nr:molybdate ABC transporter substrate-binding protein [Promicromonospora citrea]NNH51045.1 molybdate ABC transporter substrate-binding protein [Promicromonospora citrea]GGM29823.1 molybdate-binding protein [Promicromonospora citrea]
MRRVVPAATAVLLLTAGCASGDADAATGETTLTVFAAASLTATFEEIGEEFERTHEGVEVAFSFAGSSDLVAQVQEGAPADLVASADEATMERLTADGLAGADPVAFASNTLRIAVPAGNPADVSGLADLAGDLDVVVCAPEVPCGAATQRVARRAGVELSPVSEERSVTDVLAKVTTGEADAGLVYVTDVAAAGGAVEGVAFPEAAAAVNVYPIAAVAGSPHAELAAEFVDLVRAGPGQRILRDAGFAPAP